MLPGVGESSPGTVDGGADVKSRDSATAVIGIAYMAGICTAAILGLLGAGPLPFVILLAALFFLPFALRRRRK